MNAPLTAETIDLIIYCLYSNDNLNNIPIPKEIFRKLMYMAAQKIFIDKDKFCRQIDGVTMLGSITSWANLANFCLGSLENV